MVMIKLKNCNIDYKKGDCKTCPFIQIDEALDSYHEFEGYCEYVCGLTGEYLGDDNYSNELVNDEMIYHYNELKVPEKCPLISIEKVEEP